MIAKLKDKIRWWRIGYDALWLIIDDRHELENARQKGAQK